jgi:NAD(P)-dependent dehydrogenase (short-subunit alcohol dehydrogenase family)
MNTVSLYSLEDKTAVVTGGTGILGRRFCHALAEFGANVAVVDLDAGQAETLAQELVQAHGVGAIGMRCDVTLAEDVSRTVRAVVERFGGIHILHNNAASKSDDLAAFFAPFEDYSLSEWRKVMSVNLDGMFLVAQAVGGQMVRQGGGGSIIQTASIYGVVAPDQRIYRGSHYLGREFNTPAVYAASKAAVIGLTRYLAAYWADKGIRVNSISPGGVESGQNDTFQRNYAKRVPMARMARGDEMAGALVYLASDASSYMTGQNIVVDGGLSVW